MQRTKKSRIKRYLFWVCAAAVVAGLAALPLLVEDKTTADGPVASVMSASVQSGSIHNALQTGGTLSADTMDVTIPDGVKVEAFLVNNGDHVTEGTPLAAVDRVSVMAAIGNLNETLDFIHDKIEEAQRETTTDTIKATAGGRVKMIYAQEGDSVQDVILSNGALALLSLDGLMAVRFEVASDAMTGQNVDVTLSDGTVVAGRVESNLDGVVVITIEDEGYTIGSNVHAEGFGTGTLYVHNAWKALANTGIVKTVKVEEEDVVSSGTTLFILTDTEFAGELEYRLSQHSKYEALLQELLQIYDSGTINAPCDGVISGIDENSEVLLSNVSGQSETTILGGGGGSVQPPRVTMRILAPQILLNNGMGTGGTSGSTTCVKATEEGKCTATTHDPACIQACTQDDACTATGKHKLGCIKNCTHAGNVTACPNPDGGYHYSDCIKSCINAASCTATKHYSTCVKSCISSDGKTDCPATKDHNANCIERCTHADVASQCDANPHHYTDCIKSCTGKDDCPATKHNNTCALYGMTYTAIAAKVDSVGSGVLVVYYDNTTKYDVEKTSAGWVIKNGGSVKENLLITSGTLTSSNAKQFQEGDIVLSITGYKNGNAEYTTVALYKRTSSGAPSGGMPSGGFGGGGMSGGFGGGGGFGSYGGILSEDEDEGLYPLEGATLLSITPQDTMTVSGVLDETEIMKVKVGMEATVKIKALRDKTYPATITSVGYVGESNGGNSKYPVEFSLDADKDMLDGMSATMEIILETRENVPVIPVAALNGNSVDTIVYTAINSETGELTGPVSVTVGQSDGTNVEILDGLNIGDTVMYYYYEYTEPAA